MERFTRWIEKNRTKVWFALLLNGLFLAFLFVIALPAFETNDDISVSMIANGIRGSRDARVIIQNYLIGLIYVGLYGIGHGRIPWYAIFQYAVLLTSFSVVTYILMHRFEMRKALLINGIFALFFGFDSYISMQYSKTAGIAMAAGVLLMFYGIQKEKLSRKAVIAGILLGFLGSLYRFEEAACCLALMSGIGLFALLEFDKIPKGKRGKQLLIYVLCFGILGGSVVGAELFDRHMYYGTPRWEKYQIDNDLRCELMDYGTPDFEQYQEQYEALGINQHAFNILRKGFNYYDPEVFTTERVQSIVNMREKRLFDRWLIRDFFLTYPIGYFEIQVFYCFLLFAVAWLFWKKKGYKSLIVAGYEIVVMGCIDLYLFYTGRYLKNRVEVAFWFAITLVVIWLYDNDRIRVAKENVAIVLASLLLVLQPVWKTHWRIDPELCQAEIDRETRKGWCEDAVRDDPDALYLAKLGTFTYSNYGIFDPVPEGLFRNVVWYGGWEMGNPNWVDDMARFQVVSPYGDIIDRDDIYVADVKVEMSEDYINDYHQKNVKGKMAKEFGNIKLYQFESTKGEKANE